MTWYGNCVTRSFFLAGSENIGGTGHSHGDQTGSAYNTGNTFGSSGHTHGPSGHTHGSGGQNVGTETGSDTTYGSGRVSEDAPSNYSSGTTNLGGQYGGTTGQKGGIEYEGQLHGLWYDLGLFETLVSPETASLQSCSHFFFKICCRVSHPVPKLWLDPEYHFWSHTTCQEQSACPCIPLGGMGDIAYLTIILQPSSMMLCQFWGLRKFGHKFWWALCLISFLLFGADDTGTHHSGYKPEGRGQGQGTFNDQERNDGVRGAPIEGENVKVVSRFFFCLITICLGFWKYLPYSLPVSLLPDEACSQTHMHCSIACSLPERRQKSKMAMCAISQGKTRTKNFV